MNGADTDDDDDDCGLSFIHYVSYKYNQQGESARLLQVQSARRISTRSASIKIETLCSIQNCFMVSIHLERMESRLDLRYQPLIAWDDIEIQHALLGSRCPDRNE